MEQRLNAQFKQQQQLSQEQQFSLKLLQMSTIELQAEIEQALDDNPLLNCEESSDHERIDVCEDSHSSEGESNEADEDRTPEAEAPLEAMYDDWSRSASDTSFIEQIADKNNFQDDLRQELFCLPQYSERERFFASCLIEELDERGFLCDPISTIALEYEHIAREEGYTDVKDIDWITALQHIQALEPTGIGASGPIEAMILQAERRVREGHLSPTASVLLTRILRNDLLELARNNRKALLKHSCSDEKTLSEALDTLSHLNPYPIHSSSREIQYVQPDIVIRLTSGQLRAILPSALRHEIRIGSRADVDKLSDEHGRQIALRYAGEARAFIKALNARYDTLQRIGDILIREQQQYFLEGPQALKPWTLSKLAEELGVAASTVSRAVSGKFVLCSHGMIELRSFFTTSSFKTITNHGEEQTECSAASIRKKIENLIKNEDPSAPLTDEALCEILKSRNITIARRTVAKYRESAAIPSARVRKRH